MYLIVLYSYIIKMEPFNPNDGSPVENNPCGQFICSQQKIMIINIYKAKLAQQANSPEAQELKYKDLIKSISEVTGIGQQTIISILSDYKKEDTVASPNRKKMRPTILEKVDDFDKNAIRLKIHQFWLRREIPTLNKILSVINEDSSLPTFSNTSFQRILKDINFECTTKSHNCALIERGDIVLWRQKYLKSIRHYRQQNRPIYYLDETWVNVGEKTNKTWINQTEKSYKDTYLKMLTTGQKNSSENNKRLIIVHIGSSEGFVPGGLLSFESKKNLSDYHDEINDDTFYNWFTNILPLLKDKAVIVMDDASYHSVKKYPWPVMSWKKQDIIDWLEAKGEIIDRPLVKQQLLEKVSKLKPLYDQYVIDEVARKHNKIVLRLPPFHCELNPIELAWSALKNYFRMNNTTYKLMNVQRLLNDSIEHVTPNMWNNFVNDVVKEENKFWEVDFISDELLDNEPAESTSHIISRTGLNSSESDDE